MDGRGAICLGLALYAVCTLCALRWRRSNKGSRVVLQGPNVSDCILGSDASTHPIQVKPRSVTAASAL